MRIINIRESVFETNSSSTHCIVLNKDDTSIICDYKKCIENDRITFDIKYDWGWDNCNNDDIANKLSYIFTTLLTIFVKDNEYKYGIYDKKNYDLVKESESDKLQIFHNEMYVGISKVDDTYKYIDQLVFETTGYHIYCYTYNEIKDEIINPTLDPLRYCFYSLQQIGYVDHSDEKYKGIVAPILQNENDLKRFLFDNKSLLITSNDNDDPAYEVFINKSYNYYGGNG
jgi:hypothetical protein